MEESLKRFLQGPCRLADDEKLLLAVSGGVDSVVMAHLLSGCGYDIGLAHVNFFLRGKESEADEVFVRQLAENLKVPFYVHHVDTSSIASERGISIQEAAREARYEWLGELRAREGYDLIVIAHHRDDELESFFINLLRGTGIRGLTGYPPRKGHILRPLLFTGRDDILAWARAHGVSWREDSSNSSDKYLRNRIRHELLPLLEDFRQGSRARMLGNMARLASEEALLKVFTARPENEILEPFTFSLPAGMPDEALPAWLMTVLSPAGFSFLQTRDILRASEGSEARRFCSPTHELAVRARMFALRPLGPKDGMEFILKDPDDTSGLPLDLNFQAFDRSSLAKLDQGSLTALLDADAVRWPLVLRKWKAGDRFRPLGMGGSKTVSDFLMDQKVGLLARDRVWVLLSGDRIIWLVGYRIDHHFRITERTERVLRVTVQSGDDRPG